MRPLQQLKSRPRLTSKWLTPLVRLDSTKHLFVMGLRFEEINPPKKEEKPAAKKPAAKKAKTTTVEESTNS